MWVVMTIHDNYNTLLTFYPTKMILKYCDMFLKLKDLCDSPTFKEVDMNNDGSVFPKDFKAQLEKSKKYTKYVYTV